MKTSVWCCLLAVCCCLAAVWQRQQPAGGQQTISVTGTGSVSAAPDQAVVMLAVGSQAQTAAQAASDNAALTSRTLAAVAALGIHAVATSDYSLSPLYATAPTDELDQPARLVGFAARNAVTVTLDDVARIGELLDAATAAGATEVTGIRFALRPATQASLHTEALHAAVRDACHQASVIEAGLAVRRTAVLSASPSPAAHDHRPLYAAAARFATPVESPTLQVQASVQIVFAVQASPQ